MLSEYFVSTYTHETYASSIKEGPVIRFKPSILREGKIIHTFTDNQDKFIKWCAFFCVIEGKCESLPCSDRCSEANLFTFSFVLLSRSLARQSNCLLKKINPRACRLHLTLQQFRKSFSSRGKIECEGEKSLSANTLSDQPKAAGNAGEERKSCKIANGERAADRGGAPERQQAKESETNTCCGHSFRVLFDDRLSTQNLFDRYFLFGDLVCAYYYSTTLTRCRN